MHGSEDIRHILDWTECNRRHEYLCPLRSFQNPNIWGAGKWRERNETYNRLAIKKDLTWTFHSLNDIQTPPSLFFFPFIYFWVTNCMDSFHLRFLHPCHYCTWWPWFQDILLRTWDGIHLYSHRWWRWCKYYSHNHCMHSCLPSYRHFQLQTCKWHLVYHDPWFK